MLLFTKIKIILPTFYLLSKLYIFWRVNAHDLFKMSEIVTKFAKNCKTPIYHNSDIQRPLADGRYLKQLKATSMVIFF